MLLVCHDFTIYSSLEYVESPMLDSFIVYLLASLFVDQMSSTDFPLRWEGTGDQWWYASPIDWAAANGHYDLVRQLLRLDANHLIKLTSLRRIHRLESVWDDDEHFDHVSRNRSEVAHKLFCECETNGSKNSLIEAGYGGWLMYTAASAGDMDFVKKLLKIDPLMVFGEGEYGVTDVLYAAARSKNSEIFRLLLDFALLPRLFIGNDKETEHIGEIPSAYRREMINRAIHAAARGGNLVILKDLLECCSDILTYRDNEGSTILHAAAGRGQVEVVKDLIASSDIINSVDNQGNTSLHVAAYRGQLAAVEVLMHASPPSMYSKNNAGETFLHRAVAGFQIPIFRRVDRQIELMKNLARGNNFVIEEIINAKNNDGRTALHLAVIGNIHTDLVELLMTAHSINVNICDNDGMTALDLLKQRPRSASSEILTRQLISAGGIFNCQDHSARKVIASHLRMRSIESSPGTSFEIPDSEILSQMVTDKGSNACGSARLSPELAQPNKHVLIIEKQSPKINIKSGSATDASQRWRRLLHWPKMRKRKSKPEPEPLEKTVDENSVTSSEEVPVSLRSKYSKPSSLPNHKRALSVRSNAPSPTAKKKFASGLVHGVMQAMPHFNATRRTRSCSFSKSPATSSPYYWDKQKGLYVENEIAEASCSNSVLGDETPNVLHKPAFAHKRPLINQICFRGKPQQREFYDPSIPSFT
ncbi:hypothetical protein ACET3Z_022305 [Daucus carota]